MQSSGREATGIGIGTNLTLVRDYSLYYVDDSGSRHYLGNETQEPECRNS